MALHLYNINLQRPDSVTLSIVGNFLGTSSQQQILVARGQILELLASDDAGTLQTIDSTEVFGVIRSMVTLNVQDRSRSCAAICSNSGKISIVEYSSERNALVKLTEETIGRWGSKRSVAGQFLATDAKCRSIVTSALEKQKLAFIVNADGSSGGIIGPNSLENLQPNTLTMDLVGLSSPINGNPQYASIEVDFSAVDTSSVVATYSKTLVFYEIDSISNSFIRKHVESIERTSHKLIPVNAGSGAQGGVIICSKYHITYRSPTGETQSIPLPSRLHTLTTDEGGNPDSGSIISCYTHWTVETSNQLVSYLLQTEHGDLFMLQLSVASNKVKDITLFYAATVPPANSIIPLHTSSGQLFLHIFPDSGNSSTYQVHSSPTDLKNTFQSSHYGSLLGGNANGYSNGGMEIDGESNGSTSTLCFKPQAVTWLSVVDEPSRLAPIIDMKVVQSSNDESPHILTLSGGGVRSTLSILRHGLQANRIGGFPIGAHAINICTFRTDNDDFGFDRYAAVSFANATLVLIHRNVDGKEQLQAINEGDPLYGRLLTNTSTLSIGRCGEGVAQVHGGGIRYVYNQFKSLQELPSPSDTRVIHAALSEQQIILGLKGSSNNLMLYELEASGKLSAAKSFSAGGDILALANQRSILAVATADDKGSKIMIYSLASNSLMTVLNVQSCSWKVSSLSILPLTPAQRNPSSSNNSFILGIGGTNGIFSRYIVDRTTGQLSEGRDKLLGSKPVKIVSMRLPGDGMAMIATSSRPWILYHKQHTLQLLPICEQFDQVAQFHTKQSPFSILATIGQSLTVISIRGFTSSFACQRAIPLSYTPRQFCVDPSKRFAFVAEADHNAHSLPSRYQLQKELLATSENDKDPLTDAEVGVAKPGPAKWGSCIRAINVETGDVTQIIPLENNEAAFSICTGSFRDHSGETYVCVGTARDLVLSTRKGTAYSIHVYSFDKNNQELRLIHTRQVEELPGALTMFQSRLLAGIGPTLKIFDLSIKSPQLLRKCELGGFPTHIATLSSTKERIIVGDSQESVHYVKYSRPDSLSVIAGDSMPRWITSVDILDFNVVAGSDKFGNIFVLRLPEKHSQVESETAPKSSTKSSIGGSHKLESLCAIHIGEMVTRVQKIRLASGSAEFLLYSTVLGRIGALVPLTSKPSIEFFAQFELSMRQEHPSLIGRDHMASRSSYFPVKNVIDGDLLEQFYTLSPEKRDIVSSQLDQPIEDIERKLEDARALI